jgi:hypothetical protein
MVMGHRLALDFPLLNRERYVPCCTYINTSGILKECADYILQQAKWLREQSLKTQVSTKLWDQIKSWLPSRTWFLPLLGSIVATILLFVFGPCILNLLAKCVSSHLESIKLQMPLMEMKMTYYHGPLDNSSPGQPWCCGTLHCPLSAGIKSLNRLIPVPKSS